jgi:3-hydroxyisobutyrate dehydrogenase
MARVAMLGLGRMGCGIAQRVLAAGHELCVYNRSRDKARALLQAGARLADTPRQAAEAADAIIAMVADDEASRAVWLGPEGAVSGASRPGAFAVECSTLSRGWVEELSAAAGARKLRYLDAPVTGLPEAAAAGTLTLLVGAGAEDLEAARQLLAAFCQRIVHFGPIGAGTAYKLIINMIGAVQIASAAEGMALAERAGLDLRRVAEAIADSQAASPQVVRNTQRMASSETDRQVIFTPALRLKDVQYALQLSRELGMGSPFGALAAESFRAACELGLSQENESRVFEVARGLRPQPG